MGKTLSFYLIRRYFASFLSIMLGLLTIVYVAEMLELLRRSAVHTDVGFNFILGMAALKLPQTLQVLLPSAILFTALHFFWSMTQTRELEVARAAGISVWNFLTPVILVALFIGFFEIFVINPFAAAMMSRYERLDGVYFKNQETAVRLSSSGVWISQSKAENSHAAFIHAQSMRPHTFTLTRVTVFERADKINEGERVDADMAELKEGYWLLTNVYRHPRGVKSEFLHQMRLPTDLTRQRIEEGFSSPNSLSFWQLPAFIRTLDAAGLSSVRHRLYFDSLLAKPVLLAAMTLVAAVFGLRQTRRGGVFRTIVIGLVLGLLLFILNDVLQTFAASGGMPILLAAWGPALMGLMAGAAALFHYEDG